MGTILGITGAIGSGKSTLADMLAQLEPRSTKYEIWQLVAEVAEPFNDALASELSFEVADDDIEVVNQALIWWCEAINEQLHQDVVWTQLALTPHRLAVHPEYYEKLFTHLKALKTNPQFAKQSITTKNKEAFRPLLQWVGGYLVAAVSKTIWLDELLRRIERYDSDKKLVIISGLRYPADAEAVRTHDGLIVEISRPEYFAQTNTDITETHRSEIKPDVRVVNNGTLEQLAMLAEKLCSEVAVGNPAKRYVASLHFS